MLYCKFSRLALWSCSEFSDSGLGSSSEFSDSVEECVHCIEPVITQLIDLGCFVNIIQESSNLLSSLMVNIV